MIEHIPIYHQKSHWQGLARNKDLGLEITNRCTIPTRALVIDWDGECFLCTCEAWLPISVGKIDDFTELKQVWSNPIAQKIQADVAERRYSWCAVNACNIVEGDITFLDRYQISINIDESCNLRCPSCRKDTIMLDSGPDYDHKLNRARHLVRLLEEFDQPCHIIMSGNGDPLASHIMRPIIHDFRPSTNQTFRLFTNGLLIRKQLDKSRIVPQIIEYQISIDAGSKDVYEKVRLGGQWSKLMENFDFLKTVTDQHRSQVWLMLVLQKENYQDLQNFADLCAKYGWIGNITQLTNWYTWDDYAQHDVIGNPHHPEHALAKKSLSDLKRQNLPYINISPALASAANL